MTAVVHTACGQELTFDRGRDSGPGSLAFALMQHQCPRTFEIRTHGGRRVTLKISDTRIDAPGPQDGWEIFGWTWDDGAWRRDG